MQTWMGGGEERQLGPERTVPTVIPRCRYRPRWNTEVRMDGARLETARAAAGRRFQAATPLVVIQKGARTDGAQHTVWASQRLRPLIGGLAPQLICRDGHKQRLPAELRRAGSTISKACKGPAGNHQPPSNNNTPESPYHSAAHPLAGVPSPRSARCRASHPYRLTSTRALGPGPLPRFRHAS